MGKGGGGKQEVTDYFMSAHYGICSNADALLGIYVGEKVAWEGNLGLDPHEFFIDRTDLFGGNKKEGGVRGKVHWLPGGDDQVLPEYLAAKLGLTSATAPGYRGVASLFFTSTTAPASDAPPWLGDLFENWLGVATGSGFLWSSNTPYLKPIWMKVQRAPKGLNPAYRMIGNTVSATVDGYNATIGAETVVLTDGVSASVGGHSVAVTYTDSNPSSGSRTVTIDGVAVVIAYDEGQFTVTIESDTRTEVAPGSTVNIYGMSITVGATRTDLQFGGEGTDANPAHMIYECLTNTEWGMGAPASAINVAAFEAAGQTLFNEGLGLSMTWMSSDTIENFIGEIIKHALATVFVNPADGLITIKLIRDDYNVADLPVLTPDNCSINKFDRKLWGETTNEIVVTWTNPVNEGEETVTVQNLANCAIQQDVVSDSRDYHGVRNSPLATRLAVRDLRSASSPLADFDIDVDRSAWNFVPGGVAKLVYPEEGIDGLIIRLGKIDYGKPGVPTIRIAAMEDVFGLPVGAYTVIDDSQWEDPTEQPNAIDYVRVLTAPRYFVENALDPARVTVAAYPEVVSMVLASQDSRDAFEFDMLSEEIQPDGSEDLVNLGTRRLIRHATLVDALPAAATSQIVNLANVVGPLTQGSLFVVIGDGEDDETEFAIVTDVDDVAGVTIKRGLLDTVPRAWPVGTPIWMFGAGNDMIDPTARSAGETVTYKLLPRTSAGALLPEDAPDEGGTLTERPWLPNRPANVIVGGVAFGAVDLGSATSIPVTWSTRNRLMEPTEVVGWTDASITPEEGQTTRITVMATDRSVLTTHDALPGDSFTVPAASFLGEAAGIIRVTAVRDGFESLQGHEIAVSLDRRGYGNNYGNFYGG